MRARFGNCVFDSESRTLLRNGASVPLSPKGFALLEELLVASPAAVSKETLYARLWPDTFVEQGNLHNLISEIRAAIGDDEHEIIRTVHRFGYAFAGSATALERTRFAVDLGGEAIPLHDGENLIGRESDAAIVINAPDVSRHHARLTVLGGAVTIEDLDSKNGTFVNGTRISAPLAISAGDDIAIGRTHIRLRTIHAAATITST